MNVDMLFRIAGIGILVAVITQLLKQSGRDEMATIAAITGLVIGLLMMVDIIGDLFESVRQVFQLY
ncbi:stage III sporulation protein AC [Eubacteriales bacterium OttesenSCG-928-K08]|nr:stage III sporulation protein AC [Eubacteriales bacterium OttesenSCG-928-K08]